tara:strand:+ start:4939 stop:5313 length:375 start_codon:yes stop_codon:yes gene_type:complete
MTFGAENTPWFQPPSWLFGPIWTTLYTLMALSIYNASQIESNTIRITAYVLFAIQLLMNFIWPPIFDSGEYGLSLLIILVMVGSSIGYALTVRPESSIAFWLILPYILWISFATVLNIWYIQEG